MKSAIHVATRSAGWPPSRRVRTSITGGHHRGIARSCARPGEERRMHRVIRAGELQPSPGGTITFEGEAFGSGVSFFLVNNEPGAGPDLHRHPYSETWIVRAGKARFTADGEDF